MKECMQHLNNLRFAPFLHNCPLFLLFTLLITQKINVHILLRFYVHISYYVQVQLYSSLCLFYKYFCNFVNQSCIKLLDIILLLMSTQHDVFLISGNAMCYNSPGTTYYRQVFLSINSLELFGNIYPV